MAASSGGIPATHGPQVQMPSETHLGESFVSPFDVGVVDYVGHKLKLYSPYLKKKHENVFSTFFEKEKLQVDHIFVSKQLKVHDYLSLPTVDSEERPSLLCADFPSDHYPIGVNFSI